MPDSPKVKLERERKEEADAAEVHQKETKQMLEEIK